VRLGLNPEMNALATLFIALVSVGVVAANIYMSAMTRKREKEMRLAFANG
jgi:putrescine transport system permease protein